MKNLHNLLQKIDKISKIIKKNKFILLIDIIFSKIVYGSSVDNYLFFKFYNLTFRERNSYVTYRLNKKIVRQKNDRNYTSNFRNKALFAIKFEKFFKRDWLEYSNASEEKFVEFIKNKTSIIVKPIDSAFGQGIFKINVSNIEKPSDLYNKLKTYNNGKVIVEEWINQHQSINRLYSKAVNPIRLITIVNKGNCYILTGGITIGNGREYTNASCGDMVAPIDLTTGEVLYPAEDGDGNIYNEHPETRAKIKGFQIPYWEDIIKMVNEASSIVPEIKYVGWDIAVTNNGPIIIEGNTSPGYKYYQMSNHLTNNIGNKKIYTKYLR